MNAPIYLDHNSTTPILPEVVDAITQCYSEQPLNPASQHRLGQKARRTLEAARQKIADLLNVRVTDPNGDRIIFTSGGTEANNLALFGLSNPQQITLISSIEHPSVLETSSELHRRKVLVETLKCHSQGQVALAHFNELVAQDKPLRLVSVMAANNETGVIQPIREIAQTTHEIGAFFHSDCAQLIGKIPFDFQELPFATVTIAAHKFHGPRGIGALLVRKQTPLNPILFGGSQQMGLRPGTESVALVVGMAKALELAHQKHLLESERVARLRDRFERELLQAFPSIVVNGAEPRLPNTSNLSFPGLDRQALFMALDFANIACSTGSACTSGSAEPSHVLQAMSLDECRISSAIRFSLGVTSNSAEIDQAISRIIRVLNDLRFPNSGGFSVSSPR